MKRVPLAILMSGTGSNARKILACGSDLLEPRVIITDNPASNARAIAEEFGVEFVMNDIYAACGLARGQAGAALSPEERARLADPARRRAFDQETARILERCGARLAAAAGWDWILGPALCRGFFIANVHPGDLRAKDPAGRRRYTGLGWIPSAKAILNGEHEARSSTHLVTETLDGGPIARVSRPVAIELPAGKTPGNILPPGVTLKEVARDLRENGGSRFGNCLLVSLAKRIQERLKEVGDWVEFPLTLHRLAGLLLEGRLENDPDKGPLLDGSPTPDMFLAD